MDEFVMEAEERSGFADSAELRELEGVQLALIGGGIADIIGV